MISTAINTTISVIIGGLVGYLTKTITNYKNELKKKQQDEKLQNTALLMLLQFQLTNTFFVYDEMGQIPDYVYKNWLNLLKIYEELGGDDYVHTLAKKMEKWKITKTDILK